MNTFTIHDTEFGIDVSRVRLTIESTGTGDVSVLFEAHGAEQLFDTLTDDEDSEWSWALYPPYFYLRGLTVPASHLNNVLQLPEPDESDEIETAIYLMEHNPLLDLRIVVAPSSHIEVSGVVEVIGEPKPFHLRYEM